MELKHELCRLCELYGFPNDNIEYKKLCGGHINRTYFVKAGSKEYIFQNVNTYVFRDPYAVMENIRTVDDYLASNADNSRCGCPIKQYLSNRHGENYTILENGSFWRISPYVAASMSLSDEDGNVKPGVLYGAGFAFGDFIRQLSGMDPARLKITIPDFHNTKKRLSDLFEKAEEDPCGLAKTVKAELEFFYEYRERAEYLGKLWDSGELPTRVVHNDTKYNNILMDTDSDKPLCVIDLDTIMPGLCAHDFGDAVRFAANTAVEDETDLSKVSLDLDRCSHFTSGFVKAASDFMTAKERETLALGAPTITTELASRFLCDYLDGDKYFSICRPGHNLDRARCQIALAKDMFAKLDDMQCEIVRAVGASQ